MIDFLKWWWKKYDHPDKFFGSVVVVCVLWILIGGSLIVAGVVKFEFVLAALGIFLLAALILLVVGITSHMLYKIFKTFKEDKEKEAQAIVDRLRGDW